jgi:hypothetical protein
MAEDGQYKCDRVQYQGMYSTVLNRDMLQGEMLCDRRDSACAQPPKYRMIQQIGNWCDVYSTIDLTRCSFSLYETSRYSLCFNQP